MLYFDLKTLPQSGQEAGSIWWLCMTRRCLLRLVRRISFPHSGHETRDDPAQPQNHHDVSSWYRRQTEQITPRFLKLFMRTDLEDKVQLKNTGKKYLAFFKYCTVDELSNYKLYPFESWTRGPVWISHQVKYLCISMKHVKICCG